MYIYVYMNTLPYIVHLAFKQKKKINKHVRKKHEEIVEKV